MTKPGKRKKPEPTKSPPNSADAAYAKARAEFDDAEAGSRKRGQAFNKRLEQTMNQAKVDRQEGWDG